MRNFLLSLLVLTAALPAHARSYRFDCSGGGLSTESDGNLETVGIVFGRHTAQFKEANFVANDPTFEVNTYETSALDYTGTAGKLRLEVKLGKLLEQRAISCGGLEGSSTELYEAEIKLVRAGRADVELRGVCATWFGRRCLR